MKKIKLISVVGARPQFIKLAPLAHEIAAHHTDIEHIIVHTGQHYDYALSQHFFDELKISAPKYNLEAGSARHVVQMATVMARLDAILETEKPDLVLVFGDTNSTAAAAITTAKNHIPLAHVEAGLREFNKAIPEEINKLLTDSVCDLYFPPTETGVWNLRAAGITKNIFKTGDIGFDLIFNNLEKINSISSEILSKYKIKKDNYFFVTSHRASNAAQPEQLKEILQALKQLQTTVIFPAHPRTREIVTQNGFDEIIKKSNIQFIEPIGFFETQALIRNAKMVLTDSGGVTKEAYFHHRPCVILQEQIEWLEIVDEGWAKLCTPKAEKIVEIAQNFETPATHRAQLGDGTAAKKIISAIRFFLINKKSDL